MNDPKKPEWMNDPLLADIDPIKLELLQTLVFESKNVSREQMLPFMMSLAKRGNVKNTSFTDAETEIIVTVLKKHAAPGDLDKINKVMAMRRSKRN